MRTLLRNKRENIFLYSNAWCLLALSIISFLYLYICAARFISKTITFNVKPYRVSFLVFLLCACLFVHVNARYSFLCVSVIVRSCVGECLLRIFQACFRYSAADAVFVPFAVRSEVLG